jgi:hypothetical protein
MRVWIGILVFLWGQGMGIGRAWAGEEVQTPASFCADLQNERDQIKGVSRYSVIRDFLRLALFPGKLVSVRTERVKIPDANLVRQPDSIEDEGERAHLIFSIDPPLESVSRADLETMRREYQALNQELAEAAPLLMRLIYAPSIEACVGLISETQFDYAHFLELISSRSRYRLLEQIDEAAHAHRAIFKMQRRSRMNWTVIHSTDLSEVHRALSDPRVQDVVIFAHGLSGGRIMDSRGSAYPLTFFNQLSINLRSISIFACHGEESVDLYDLKKSLSRGLSTHPERAVMVSIGSHLGGRDELVPVASFKSFMKRVERTLGFLRNAEWNLPEPTREDPGERMCRVGVSGFKVKEGTFGFILNGQFVGALHSSGSDTEVMDYPCAFLNAGKNIISIRSLGLFDRGSLEREGFKLEPISPGYQIGSPSLVHYSRPDGSYQGSVMSFDLGGPSGSMVSI